MGIISRLLLLPFTLGVTACALSVLAVALRIIPEAYWQNELRFALAQQETIFVAGAYFILSLYFLVKVFTRNKSEKVNSKEYAIINTVVGTVRVELSAIKKLLENVTGKVQGVHSVAAKVTVIRKEDGETLTVSLRVAMSSECNVTKVSEELVTLVREELAKVISVQDIPVEIEITEIAKTASTAKKRVV